MVGFKLTAGWIAKYAPELNGQMKEATLKDLLNGSKPFVKPGWRKVAAPSSVHGLADGASLVGLSAGPAAARPDYDQTYPHAFAAAPVRHIAFTLPVYLRHMTCLLGPADTHLGWWSHQQQF